MQGPVSFIRTQNIPLSSQNSASPLRAGDSVFIRVLSDNGGGSYTVSLLGNRVNVQSEKILLTGSSFHARLSFSQDGTVLLSPNNDFVAETSALQNEASLLPDGSPNALLASLLASQGLTPDAATVRLLQFFQQSGMRIDMGIMEKARLLALRFPGKEKRASEIAAILLSKGIPTTEDAVEEILLLLDDFGSAGGGGHERGKQKNQHGEGNAPTNDGSLQENTRGAQENAGAANKTMGVLQDNAGGANKTSGVSQETADFSRETADFSQENAGFSRENAGFSQENAGFSQENAVSPDQPASFPNQAAVSPDQAASFPNQAASSPDQTASFPDQTASSPNQPAVSPDQTASSPDQAASSPDQTASSPDQTASSPDQPASSLDQTASFPNQPASFPDQPASFPDQPASSPDQTASSPDQTASSPNQPASSVNQSASSPNQSPNSLEKLLSKLYPKGISADGGLLTMLNQIRSAHSTQHWLFLPYQWSHGGVQSSGIIRMLLNLDTKVTEKVEINYKNSSLEAFFVLYYSESKVKEIRFWTLPPLLTSDIPLEEERLGEFLCSGMSEKNSVSVTYSPCALIEGLCADSQEPKVIQKLA